MKKILLQKGHVAPRQPGFESATGAAGEQEVVTALVNAVAAKLKTDKRFSVQVIPGKVPPGLDVDLFVSFHCDGSSDPDRKGWGVGYPQDPTNKTFAQVFAKHYGRLQPSKRLPDNYTRDMQFYYGFRHVPTPGPEILVEHGFVSSPQEKRWLLANVKQIADVYYQAFLEEFDMKPPGPTPVPDDELEQLRKQVKKQQATIKALRKRISDAQEVLGE